MACVAAPSTQGSPRSLKHAGQQALPRPVVRKPVRTPCRGASPGRCRELSPTRCSVLELVPKGIGSPRLSSVGRATRSQLGLEYESLDKARQEHAKRGDFRAAEEAKLQLKALKARREQVLLEEHLAQHRAFLRVLEETHAKEIGEFERAWGKRACELEDHAELVRTALDARQTEEHANHLAKLQAETEPRAPRWSRDLLQLRRQQERASDQQRYEEAAKLKAQGDALEEQEQGAWQYLRDVKIAAAEAHFLAKQQAEWRGLEERIAAGRQEFELAFAAERQRLDTRCENVKAQVSARYRLLGNHVERMALVYSPRNAAGSPRLWTAAGA